MWKNPVDNLQYQLRARNLIKNPAKLIDEKLFKFIIRCLINYSDYRDKNETGGQTTFTFDFNTIIISTKKTYYHVDLPYSIPKSELVSYLTKFVKKFHEKYPKWKIVDGLVPMDSSRPILFKEINKLRLTFQW